jgi:hypothetical protein
MGHGVLPTHQQGDAQFPVGGGAGLELACGGLPLHLRISAAVEQGSQCVSTFLCSHNSDCSGTPIQRAVTFLNFRFATHSNMSVALKRRQTRKPA